MKTLLSLLRTRAAGWLGLAALALSQAGCAHPVVMEPSVVVQGRIGGPVYGSVVLGPTVYGPPPVVVGPPPLWLPPPPPVVMAPRVLSPYPVYPAYPPQAYARPWRGERHGHGHGHGWGRRGW
jgi:hypothetical protein